MSDLRKEIERQFKLLGLFEPDKKTTEKIPEIETAETNPAYSVYTSKTED